LQKQGLSTIPIPVTTLSEIIKATEDLTVGERQRLVASLLVSLRKTDGGLSSSRLYSPDEVAAMLAEDELTESMVLDDVQWGLHGKG
jgi:hypothetical protein